MKHYLVDLENVQEHGLSDINLLDRNSIVYIFFTKNVVKVSLNCFINSGVPPRIKSIECPAGEQSLDKCLIGYLGYLLKKHSKDKFFIVSEDKGYDKVIEFMKKTFNSESTLCDVTRIEVFSELKVFPKVNPMKSDSEFIAEADANDPKMQENMLFEDVSFGLPQEETIPTVSIIPMKCYTKNQNKSTQLNNRLQSILHKDIAYTTYSEKKRKSIVGLISFIVKNADTEDILLNTYRKCIHIYSSSDGSRVYNIIKKELKSFGIA